MKLSLSLAGLVAANVDGPIVTVIVKFKEDKTVLFIYTTGNFEQFKNFSRTKVFPSSSIPHMLSLDLNYKISIEIFFRVENLGRIHIQNDRYFSIVTVYHAFAVDQIFFGCLVSHFLFSLI